MGRGDEISGRPGMRRAVNTVAKAVKTGKPVSSGMTVISDVHLKGFPRISVNGIVSRAIKASSHTKTLG